jgi:ATP-dependent Lhr-like helicase
VLSFIESGGYALKAYDKFRRLTREGGSVAGVASALHQQHGMNPGSSSTRPLYNVRFRGGRLLGTVEGQFRRELSPGEHLLLFRPGARGRADRRHRPDRRAPRKSARIPTYMGARMAMTTNLAERVRHSCTTATMAALPRRRARMAEVQDYRSVLPAPDQLLVETFPHEHAPLHGRLQLRGLERAPVARHADHRRMESAG